MKKLLLYGLAAIILATISNRLIARYAMHEQALFLRAAETSDKWEEKLRKDHDSIYVLTSGSSGRFGNNPQLMLDEYDVPLVVASGVAGFGLCPNVALAWKYLREGDTLILAFEESLLKGDDTTTCTNAGLTQVASRLGLSMFQDGVIPFNYDHFRRSVQLESKIIYFNIFKSIFFPNNLYRYLYGTTLHETGWLEIFGLPSFQNYLGLISPPKNLTEEGISDDTKQYYQHLKQKAKEKKIRIIASQSPIYAHPKMAARSAWQALELTRMGIPVVYTPDFGYYTNHDWMGDIQVHLRSAGAKHFSSLLAKSLQEQRFWTEAELIDELHKRGWNEDGSRISDDEK